eukprot:4703828-Pyramimonas_sp.AAC.1
MALARRRWAGVLRVLQAAGGPQAKHLRLHVHVRAHVLGLHVLCRHVLSPRAAVQDLGLPSPGPPRRRGRPRASSDRLHLDDKMPK